MSISEGMGKMMFIGSGDIYVTRSETNGNRCLQQNNYLIHPRDGQKRRSDKRWRFAHRAGRRTPNPLWQTDKASLSKDEIFCWAIPRGS